MHVPGARRLRLLGTPLVLGVSATALMLGVLLVASGPPRGLTMATGPEGGAYQLLGEQYREIFARHGVTLRLVASGGSVDNVAKLRDARSGVSAALVQGGITSLPESPRLVSLGTMFYEPIWAFVRGPQPSIGAVAWAEGRRISIGPEGSGTHKLGRELLGALGVTLDAVRLLGLPPVAAAEALLRGEVDIVVLVAPWESPVVRRLLTAEGVSTVSYPRADAHVALRPYLNKLVVPQGVADLARNRPPADLVLVAPKTSLVVRDDLHPALQQLLLQAATRVHAAPGIFQKAGQFPAAEPIDLPLSETASDYYRSGSPFLQRYLPFWLAVLVGHFLVVLIPIFGLAYPLLRVLPAMYGWGWRRRIYRLYGELKFLEAELGARRAEEPMDDLLAELDRLEEHAQRTRTPLTFAHMLYTLRHHIELVRAQIERRRPHLAASRLGPAS